MNNTIEALTTPSIALSGVIGTIIVGVVSAQAKIKKNPLRFFIPSEEKEFMSSPMKLFRFTYISFLIFVFSTAYSLLITSVPFDLNEFSLKKTLNFLFFNIYSIIIAIVFLASMQILSMKSTQRKITAFVYAKNRKSKRRRDFILLSMIFSFVYILFFSLIYGWICNQLLIEQAKILKISYGNSLEILLSFNFLDNTILGFLLFFTILYWIIMYRAKNLFTYLGHSKITTNIFLKNGLTLENKKILHIDIENSYLISDSENDYEPNKYLIPKASIDYIRFTNIYCSLGKDILINNPTIVTTKDFNHEELSLLKSINRKNEANKLDV
ncbi:hypothetical protein NST58_20460 [Paenibacillus sp. FSL R10-2796]